MSSETLLRNYLYILGAQKKKILKRYGKNESEVLGNESESDSGWVLLYKLTLQKYGTLQNKQSTQSSVATLRITPKSTPN